MSDNPIGIDDEIAAAQIREWGGAYLFPTSARDEVGPYSWLSEDCFKDCASCELLARTELLEELCVALHENAEAHGCCCDGYSVRWDNDDMPPAWREMLDSIDGRAACDRTEARKASAAAEKKRSQDEAIAIDPNGDGFAAVVAELVTEDKS